MRAYLQSRHLFTVLFTTTLYILSFLAQSQPHLTFIDIENTDSLHVKSLNAHIELSGNTAISQLTYEITNKSEELLTANLQILLPQNAKVIGYSLDIEGTMREGVIVPKAKARHSFNTIQNRNIDPGLAEVTQGNQFKTEIYPVLSKQSRTISISYIETLAISDASQVTYNLPLSSYDKGVEINVELIATGMPSPPTYSPFKKKYVRKGKRRYRSHIKTKTGLDDLAITYEVDSLSQQKLATAEDGRHYFSLNVPLNKVQAEQDSPQKMDIYWDVSGSMAGYHQQNLKALKHIVKSYKNSLRQISLVTFANKIIKKHDITCVEYCENSVVKALSDPFYDGATYLHSFARLLKNSTADKALIFTDALNTLDSWQPVASKVPTYVLSHSGKRNAIVQKSLSAGSGGYVINLASTPLDKLTAQLNRLLPNIKLAFEKSDEVTDVFYEIQPALNRLKISGVLKDTNNILSIAANEKPLTAIDFSELTLASNNMAKHDWAIMALSALQAEPQKNRHKITQFGVQHQIVTPFTSLLVLESLAQYAEFDITPPASMVNAVNFKENWLRAQTRYRKTQYDPSFTLLIKQWEKRQQWWQSQKSMTLEAALGLIDAQNKPTKRGEDPRLLGQRSNLVPERRHSQSRRNDEDVEVIEVRGMSSTESRMRRERNVQDSESVQTSNTSSMADASIARQSKSKSSHTSTNEVAISVAKWQADAPYLKALEQVSADKIISTYRTLKLKFGTLPVFYMDVALWLHEKKAKELAVRVLSNLAELHPEVPELMRMHAYNLIQMQRYQEAIMPLMTVAQLLPYELTSYRDLANAWQLQAIKTQAAGDFKQALNYYIEALNAYTQNDISQALMMLHELNRLIYKANNHLEVNAIDLPKALLVNLPLDLFISIQWNKDATDVDLWVTEPTGQTINYTHKKGISGSYLPFDDTTGYGPEIYMNRLSLPGEYSIQAKLYNDRSTKLLGPNTLFLSIYSHYGTDKETVKHTSLRLKDKKAVVDVGSFRVKKSLE